MLNFFKIYLARKTLAQYILSHLLSAQNFSAKHNRLQPNIIK
jgi:hypothetical protein